jgi:hypothetical protein
MIRARFHRSKTNSRLHLGTDSHLKLFQVLHPVPDTSLKNANVHEPILRSLHRHVVRENGRYQTEKAGCCPQCHWRTIQDLMDNAHLYARLSAYWPPRVRAALTPRKAI